MSAICVWGTASTGKNYEKEAELSQQLTLCCNTPLDQLMVSRLLK